MKGDLKPMTHLEKLYAAKEKQATCFIMPIYGETNKVQPVTISRIEDPDENSKEPTIVIYISEIGAAMYMTPDKVYLTEGEALSALKQKVEKQKAEYLSEITEEPSSVLRFAMNHVLSGEDTDLIAREVFIQKASAVFGVKPEDIMPR